MTVTPEGAVMWLQIIAQMIILGETTYEKIAAMIKANRGATDADTFEQDNAELALLREVIAAQKAKAKIEAGQG